MTKVVTLARLDDGTFLVYFEGRPTAGWAKLTALARGHLNPTLEISPESWRISVVGTSAKLRSFLAELRRRRIHHHLLSIRRVDNPEGSPLEWLTTRQREVLVAAYRGGYYDTPRRVNSARVARQLNLGKSATVEHLRKGQKRLLDGILRG
jgi:predicted DNA binding protein